MHFCRYPSFNLRRIGWNFCFSNFLVGAVEGVFYGVFLDRFVRDLVTVRD